MAFKLYFMVIQEMKITVKLYYNILHGKTLQPFKSLSLILLILGLAVALIFAFSWLNMTISQLPHQLHSSLKVLKLGPLLELVSRNML